MAENVTGNVFVSNVSRASRKVAAASIGAMGFKLAAPLVASGVVATSTEVRVQGQGVRLRQAQAWLCTNL